MVTLRAEWAYGQDRANSGYASTVEKGISIVKIGHVTSYLQRAGYENARVKDLYRQLYNPGWYTRLYGLPSAEPVIDVLRNGYRWHRPQPVTLASGRSLMVPPAMDRCLLGAIRRILTAYYDPQLSPSSWAFRPHRGTHAMIHEIKTWHDVAWLDHYDIVGCYDAIRPSAIFPLLGNIQDRRLLDLIQSSMPTTHLPTGHPLSPLFANLYLNQLDIVMEGTYYARYADNILLGGQKSVGSHDRLSRFADATATLKLPCRNAGSCIVRVDYRITDDRIVFRPISSSDANNSYVNSIVSA